MMSSPEPAARLTAEPAKDGVYRILSLDGSGAKGFYTLGVLREIEAMINCPLYKRFDLVFGTSTTVGTGPNRRPWCCSRSRL
jgi:uncharacterized protein